MHRSGCGLWHSYSPHIRKVRPAQMKIKHSTQAHSGIDTPGYRKSFLYWSLSALLAAILTPHCNLSVRPAQSQLIAAVSIFEFHIFQFSSLSSGIYTSYTCCKARYSSQINNTDLESIIKPFLHFNFLSPSAFPPLGPIFTFIIPPTRVNVSLS